VNAIENAINARGPLAATSGAPRVLLRAELERAFDVGGQQALDAAADAASRARAVSVMTSCWGGAQ
jgi:hypothetical protein